MWWIKIFILLFSRYCPAGGDKRVRSTSLYHCRQCSCIVLKPCSDRIDYTVVCFTTHDGSRTLWKHSTTSASRVSFTALLCSLGHYHWIFENPLRIISDQFIILPRIARIPGVNRSPKCRAASAAAGTILLLLSFRWSRNSLSSPASDRQIPSDLNSSVSDLADRLTLSVLGKCTMTIRLAAI